MKREKQLLNFKIKMNMKWLEDNDYIINKVFLGEWQEDDERYLAYKVKRIEVREELDLYKAQLEYLED